MNPEIHFQSPEEPVYIMAEPLISQLFVNLLHNGIKFQGVDRAVIKVSLTASNERKSAIIEMADHGPGISDDIKSEIFDRFGKKEERLHSGI